KQGRGLQCQTLSHSLRMIPRHAAAPLQRLDDRRPLLAGYTELLRARASRARIECQRATTQTQSTVKRAARLSVALARPPLRVRQRSYSRWARFDRETARCNFSRSD